MPHLPSPNTAILFTIFLAGILFSFETSAQTSGQLTTETNQGTLSNKPLATGFAEPGEVDDLCPDNIVTFYDHCQGARPFSDGSLYEGQFVEDMPSGFGRLREPDGTTYVGEFEQGMRQGQGVLYHKDGKELYGGAWRAGLPNDPSKNFLRGKKRINLIRALQTELNRHGCDAGTVDGILGPRTKNAARSASFAKPELLLGEDPSGSVESAYRLWHSLKGTTAKACPN